MCKFTDLRAQTCSSKLCARTNPDPVIKVRLQVDGRFDGQPAN